MIACLGNNHKRNYEKDESRRKMNELRIRKMYELNTKGQIKIEYFNKKYSYE